MRKLPLQRAALTSSRLPAPLGGTDTSLVAGARRVRLANGQSGEARLASLGATPGTVTARIASGRVEIAVNGTWGTVSAASSFDERDARAVCRELGFASGVPTGGFGAGSGPIWLGNLDCK